MQLQAVISTTLIPIVRWRATMIRCPPIHRKGGTRLESPTRTTHLTEASSLLGPSCGDCRGIARQPVKYTQKRQRTQPRSVDVALARRRDSSGHFLQAEAPPHLLRDYFIGNAFQLPMAMKLAQ
jgi:hypothetical protein